MVLPQECLYHVLIYILDRCGMYIHTWPHLVPSCASALCRAHHVHPSIICIITNVLHLWSSSMSKHMKEGSSTTVKLHVSMIIWMLSRLKWLKKMMSSCNSHLTVHSSTVIRNWIAVFLCTLSTTWLLICTTRKEWLSSQDSFQAQKKWKTGISSCIPYSITLPCSRTNAFISDAFTQTHIPSLMLFVFVTANGPAMVIISGMVGHSGKFGFCLYCGFPETAMGTIFLLCSNLRHMVSLSVTMRMLVSQI